MLEKYIQKQVKTLNNRDDCQLGWGSSFMERFVVNEHHKNVYKMIRY